MKIKKIYFKDFGKFTDKEIKFKDRVNLVYGKNESGKTTTKHGIKTLLYGIYPANRDDNNFVSWDTNKFELEGTFEVNGDDYTIIRELLSYPKGRVIKGEDIKDIRNKTFQHIKHIPKHIFDNIYSLKVSDLNNLDDKSWKNIENKLIFSYDDDYILEPDVVLNEIYEELRKKWKDNRKGNFEYKELNKKLKQLKKDRVDALEDNRKIKNFNHELHDKNLRKEQLEDRLNNIDENINKIGKLLPYKNLIEEKKLLISELKKLDKFNDIDRKILDKKENLEKEIEKFKSDIEGYEERIKKNEAQIDKLDENELQILNNESKIEEAEIKYDELKYKKKELESVKNSFESKKKEYEEVFYKLFNKNLKNDDFENIQKIKLSDIENKFNLSKKYDKKMDYVLLFISFIGFVISYFTSLSFINYISVSLLVLAGYRMYANRNLKKDIVLKGGLILKNTPESKNRFEILKTLEFNVVSEKEKYNELANDINLLKKEINDLISDFDKTNNLHIALDNLKDKLKNIKEKKSNNESIKVAIREIKISKENTVNKLKKTNENFEDIISIIKDFGNGDLNEGEKLIKKNLKIESQIENVDEKLQKSDNLRIKKDYDKFDDVVSNDRLEKLKDTRNEINNQLGELNESIIELNKNISELSNVDNINEIETDIELVEERLDEIKQYKDKILIMQKIIEDSNKQFKEENQPEIINKAADYFSKFTDDNYQQIYLDSTKNNLISIRTENGIKPVTKPFSKGTKDQLFLALRLAILDFYEDDQYKIPFILDELFVNWDENRLTNFIDTIIKISEERQVIIFTCKKYLVDLFNRKDYNYGLIDLD